MGQRTDLSLQFENILLGVVNKMGFKDFIWCYLIYSEALSEPCQTPTMELFVKIVYVRLTDVFCFGLYCLYLFMSVKLLYLVFIHFFVVFLRHLWHKLDTFKGLFPCWNPKVHSFII